MDAPINSVERVADTRDLNRTQSKAFEHIRHTCEEKVVALRLVDSPQLCEEKFEKP